LGKTILQEISQLLRLLKILECDLFTPEKDVVLSICIPTYNNAGYLGESLKALIPQVREFNIPIYVSNNASNDDTLKVLKSYKNIYPLLFFETNDHNLGFDRNVVKVAQMASTKYLWAIGAKRILCPGTVSKIYQILSKSNLDLLILNHWPNVFEVLESKHYSSAPQVFRDLHRQLTYLGLQIILSEAWASNSVNKYVDTDWVHFGVSLDFIAGKQNPKIYFSSEECFKFPGKLDWLPICFQIWSNWRKVIYSLPQIYSDEDKELVIGRSAVYLMPFLKKFRLIDIRRKFTLFDLRVLNIYNSKVYFKYGEEIIRYGPFSPNVAYSIARFPIPLLKLYFRFYDIAKVILRKFVHTKTPPNPGLSSKTT
jgi:abequosyltransferase